jgi:hypothetical protein
MIAWSWECTPVAALAVWFPPSPLRIRQEAEGSVGSNWAESFQPVDIVEVKSALAIRKVLAGCQGRNSQLAVDGCIGPILA